MFSLVLSCQWFSAFSACVCEWYKKKTAFVFSFLEYIDMPLYLLILDAL